MTTGLQGKTYLEKLRDAKMLTLEERRVRGDMIKAWQLWHTDPDSSLLQRADRVNTRETRATTSRALIKESRIRLDIRRNFFTNRIVNPWNDLPSSVKLCNSLDSFKLAYDKHMFSFLF